jgi:hypothetical protein
MEPVAGEKRLWLYCDPYTDTPNPYTDAPNLYAQPLHRSAWCWLMVVKGDIYIVGTS